MASNGSKAENAEVMDSKVHATFQKHTDTRFETREDGGGKQRLTPGKQHVLKVSPERHFEQEVSSAQNLIGIRCDLYYSCKK